MAERLKIAEKNEFDKSLKLVAKSSLVVFIGIVLSKIFAYVYRIVIARYYGPEIYGIFSLAIVILGWFIAIALLGTSDGVLRFVSIYRGKNQKEKINYVVNYSTFYLIISGILAGIFMFFSAEFISIIIFHEPGLIIFLKAFSFFIPFSIIANSFLSIIRAYEKIGTFSFIFNILQNAVKVIFLIALIYFGLGKSALITSYILGTISMFLAAYFICKFYLDLFKKSNVSNSEKKKIKKAFFSYSLPLMFFGIIMSIFYWIDSLSIAYFKDAAAVGFYNAAVPIAMLLGISSAIFIQLFFPIINKEYSRKNNEVIKQLSKQVAKWIFIINIPVLIILFLFPGAALNILFGKEYLVAESALKFLSFSAFISSILIISNQLLSMEGRSKLILFDIVLASIMNLLLNWLLVPMQTIFSMDNSLGINGAALATMASTIFLNLLFFFQVKYYLDIIPLRRKMLSILIAAIIPTISILLIKNFITISLFSMVFLLTFFTLFYTFLVILFRGLDYNDLMIISSIKRKFFN